MNLWFCWVSSFLTAVTQYAETAVSMWSFSLDGTNWMEPRWNKSVQEMQRSLVSKFYACSLGGCSCVTLTMLECKETLVSQGSLCDWKCFKK